MEMPAPDADDRQHLFACVLYLGGEVPLHGIDIGELGKRPAAVGLHIDDARPTLPP